MYRHFRLTIQMFLLTRDYLKNKNKNIKTNKFYIFAKKLKQ